MKNSELNAPSVKSSLSSLSELPVPNGFRWVSWEEVEVGMMVYVGSLHKGRWYACGYPNGYQVVDKIKRRLRNGHSRYTFHIPTETLLLKVCTH